MELDALIYEVIVDANAEDEQLWGFRQAFEDALLPAGRWICDRRAGSGDHLRL